MIVSCPYTLKQERGWRFPVPILSILRQDILISQKTQLLQDLAALDVDSALPPTDTIPQDRRPILDQLRQIDVELSSIGITFSHQDAVLESEARWDLGYDD